MPAKKSPVAAAVEPIAVAPVAPVTDEPVKPAIEEPAATAPATAQTEAFDQTRFDVLVEKLALIMTTTKELIAQAKAIQKDVIKLAKEKTKKERRAAANAPNGDAPKRSPSGFAKPTRLSDELCTFLNVPTGTEMARTDVTRLLNAYIKQHELQDSSDKRRILPNPELQTILSPGEVTYFNLQSRLKHHFLSAAAAPVATA